MTPNRGTYLPTIQLSAGAESLEATRRMVTERQVELGLIQPELEHFSRIHRFGSFVLETLRFKSRS